MKNDKLLKIGIVFIALIFIFIAYKIFKVVSSNDLNINISGSDFYQYFAGIKQEYSGNLKIVTYNKRKILNLEDNSQVYLDSTPMYYKNELGKILLPNQMEIIYPSLKQNYKLKDYSIVFKENNSFKVKRYKGKDSKDVNEAFLFDGEDLYLFLEQTTITVGDTQYIVPAFSYASVNYRDYVEIYDYDKDEDIVLDNLELDKDITATTDNYKIDMSVDSLICNDVQQLLVTKLDYVKDFQY